MLQIVQYQKTGEMKVIELPAPVCPDNGILVRNKFSLISAGTEKTSVENAKGSLLSRAKKQPDQVKLVVDTIKREGIVETGKRVLSKLESYKALGYSSAGIVIESRCDEFAPGDKVACAGAGYANHAEIAAIPKNLAVLIPENVSLDTAAYTTVASIAMQGVRQAQVSLGENVAVIGLGLIGQITVQLLKASGCSVIGIDINEDLFDTARQSGCDSVCISSFDSIDQVLAFSGGPGCDSVIITAGTSSNEPINLAMKIARKKGKVVIVGAVGMDVSRSPFYQKEIDLRISCSYGPGRYDPDYEEKGIDYPVAYVRWTENRNMLAFLELARQKKMDMNILTTHKFMINDASEAYELISSDKQYMGILIEYPERNESEKNVMATNKKGKQDSLKVSFIGAGTFAQNYLLPPLKKAGVEFVGVSTTNPINAKSVAERMNFSISSTDSSYLIKSEDSNVIFCATRHDTHAKYVKEALEADKHIFVEKPLAIDENELDEIKQIYGSSKAGLMVGFNRRFSDPFKDIKKFYRDRKAPMAMNYRINAGQIPKSHWVQADDQGGRIVGEVCHFIDCMVYLTDSLPQSVYAVSTSSSDRVNVNEDNVVLSIKFKDGSIGAIEYFANGDKSLPKEYFEAFCEGSSAVMNNFKTLELFKNGKAKKYSYDGDKGISNEVLTFINHIRKGDPMPISFEEIYAVSKTTFRALDSLIDNKTKEI